MFKRKALNQTFIIICSLIAVSLFSCERKSNAIEKQLSVSGKMCSLELIPQTMSNIYYNLNGKNIDFDSCAVIEQANGYTIVVAYAKQDSLNIKFAVLAEKDGENINIRDTPPSTCTCTGNCQKGCDPEYLGTGYEWICTKCEYSQVPEPYCRKSVTANPLPKE